MVGYSQLTTRQQISLKQTFEIFNDSTPIGTETPSQIFNHGYALGAEARGGGSSFIGKFNSCDFAWGPTPGDRLVASFDFRGWEQSTNATPLPRRQRDFAGVSIRIPMASSVLLLHTEHGGANVKWGTDDGNWFSGTSTTGTEGDKGIQLEYRVRINRRSFEPPAFRWEYNKLNINGTTNNARILEGTGVTDIAGSGGDTGTVAVPNGSAVPKVQVEFFLAALMLRITRRWSLCEMPTARLRSRRMSIQRSCSADTIKTTDTGYNVIGPPPDSFNYVAMRDTADFDWAIDNFKVEVFGSNAGGTPGDYNGDGKVDAADYTVWRDHLGSASSLPFNDSTPGVDPGDYTVWKQNFGAGGGSGASSASAVPEPCGLVLLAIGGMLAITLRRAGCFGNGSLKQGVEQKRWSGVREHLRGRLRAHNFSWEGRLMNCTKYSGGWFAVACVVVTGTLLATVSPAHATLIVDDSWADGGRTDGADPLDTNWWTSTASTAIEVSVGSLGLVTGSSGRGIHGTFAPQTLNVGDTLKAYLHFYYTRDGWQRDSPRPSKSGSSTRTGMQVWRQTLSASSGTPNPIYNPLPGYMMDYDVVTGSENIQFREKDPVPGTDGAIARDDNWFYFIGRRGQHVYLRRKHDIHGRDFSYENRKWSGPYGFAKPGSNLAEHIHNQRRDAEHEHV